MALSVIMVFCLSMADGETSCKVTGSSYFGATNDKVMCTEFANSAINDRLLESGKEGWAHGMCIDRSSYVDVTKRAVDYLEGEGFKVKFESYKVK